jgi:tripartite-type tricarboxylate transporter receptor subunit TctC
MAAAMMAAATCLAGTAAVAQTPASVDYPNRQLRIIAPAAAGSGTDLTARLIATPLAAVFGQPVLVDNRVGGGGMVGMDAVVKADPDGYTLLLSTDATIAIQPNLARPGFDPSKGLAPIVEISRFPLVIVVSAESPVRRLADLVAAASSTPGGWSYGMGGRGTGGHIVGETVRLSTNSPIVAVPYPSAARAVTDLMGGHVKFAISDVISIVPHVKAGKLRAIAVAGPERTSCLPDVPTLKEEGVPFDLPYSYGLLAPAGTPPAIVERLNKEVRAALQSDALRQRQQEACQSPPPVANTPQDFAQRVREHWQRWGTLIRAANIRIE